MTMLVSEQNRLGTASGAVSPRAVSPRIEAHIALKPNRVVGTRVERLGQGATSDFAPESSVA